MDEKLLGRAFELLDELKATLDELTGDKEHIIDQHGLGELANYENRIDDMTQELNKFAEEARSEED